MVALARSRRPQPQNTDNSAFEADVLAGLSASPKRLPAKYFYDGTGSQLFERITEQPEYYPTRCEIGIFASTPPTSPSSFRRARRWSNSAPARARRRAFCCARCARLPAYVPVDICGEMIEQEAAELRPDFPELKVLPVTADITQPFDLPDAAKAAPVRVGFFPGSTIGNFEPHEAAAFLRNAAQILGPGATLIVGADLIKDADVLNAAYNDADGVTAKFNLNLLTRINRELARQFQARHLRASRLLQPRTQPHRNASRQPQAAEGEGCRRTHSTSAPAKPSTPRAPTNTRLSRWARWRAAPAGSRRRCGPTSANISRSRPSRSRRRCGQGVSVRHPKRRSFALRWAAFPAARIAIALRARAPGAG